MSNNSALSVSNSQDFWDDKQLAALTQLGLVNAPKGDLAVFLHAAQRTGLDPFARQIYMIQRGGKYTIQASIDGLRIVAQRSNNYGGQTPTYWCGQDGVWKDVWLEATPPSAAKVGVYYKDSEQPTWVIAKFDSYNTGSPIWKKMPDLMIAKCAEALALRKAFPNDLAGVYSSEEMEQADKNTVPVTPRIEPVISEVQIAEVVRDVVPVTNAEELGKLRLVLDEVDKSKSVAELKQIFTYYKDKLDYEFTPTDADPHTTLRAEIMNKKNVLSA